MDIFDVLSLVGGLALFLFGMDTMGKALEKRAGGKLKGLLEKMTSNPFKGFLLGMGVTAVIQSSSATTVMVVGFVNSGIMTLKQAISIIMGANIGTTVTAWILSLAGIDAGGTFMELLKPSSFVPVLSLIGVVILMFSKKDKKKDTGIILLGFAVLMTGMDIMSASVSGLRDVPEFTGILTLFSNPILGVLTVAVLTGIIQSSSASVGILQALSTTGAITYGSAIPIIMGQNIGTCVTALISCIGANKNAKRTAFVHLYFNLLGTAVLLVLFYGLRAVFDFTFVSDTIDGAGIAMVHTTFNVICTVLWFPLRGVLEKLAILTVKDTQDKEKYEILDERLFSTPAIAVDRSGEVTLKMAEISVGALKSSLCMLREYSPELSEAIVKAEGKADKYEDKLGSYLVKVSTLELSDDDSLQVTKLLHLISDFERISDHAVNILESCEEMHEKGLAFSEKAKGELMTLCAAVEEIVDMSYNCLASGDIETAMRVEPLEQVIDALRDIIKAKHIRRLREGRCTIELGFILTDLLTNLERVSDHCSNIAGLIIETSRNEMDIHKYLRSVKSDPDSDYLKLFEEYGKKYCIE